MADNSQLAWLSQMLGLGAGAGSMLGGAYGMFGPKQPNPADVANQYIGQIPGQTKQYYSPYMQAGKGALADLQNQNKNLLSGQTQNMLGENYKQSPGYQFKLNQAMQQQGAAAARGGMLGTPMDQQYSMQLANDIAGQDYDNYIKNQMQLYGLGYGGEGNINQMGFDANKAMADTIGNTLNQQGAYSFMGQQGQNQAKSSSMGDFFKGLGMLGGGALGFLL